MQVLRCAMLLPLILTFTAAAHQSDSNLLTVSGQGKVLKAPDVLTFSIIVEQRGQDSKRLSESVNKSSEQIIDVLLDNGVLSADIRAMEVNLYPWFERVGGKNTQKGFIFNRRVNVKFRDFDVYPTLLSKLIELDATRIEGFSYQVEDQKAAYLEALDAAMADAESKAKRLSKSHSIEIGKINKVIENSSYSPAPLYSTRALSESMAGQQPMPGLNQINASVTVSYTIER